MIRFSWSWFLRDELLEAKVNDWKEKKEQECTSEVQNSTRKALLCDVKCEDSTLVLLNNLACFSKLSCWPCANVLARPCQAFGTTVPSTLHNRSDSLSQTVCILERETTKGEVLVTVWNEGSSRTQKRRFFLLAVVRMTEPDDSKIELFAIVSLLSGLIVRR